MERASTISSYPSDRIEHRAGILLPDRLRLQVPRSLEDLQIRSLLAIPGDPFRKHPASRPSHLRPPSRVAEQGVDLARHPRDVTGLRVSRGPARQQPGLENVEA